jgi:hypothetical protein
MTIRNFRFCCAVTLLAAGCGVLRGQSNLLKKNVLTNKDVVLLAKAGFDEEFLVDVILSSPRQFDTSAPALVVMAEQGITQRLVEVMMNPDGGMPDAAVPRGVAQPTAFPVLPVSHVHSPVPVVRTASLLKLAPGRPGSGNGATYYEEHSLFWGFWKTAIGTNTPAPTTQTAVVRAPTASPRRYLPIGASSAQPSPTPMGFTTHSVELR